MHIDNFARGDSLLHRLDPRVKIVVAVLFSVVVAVADRQACLATAVCLSLVLLFMARLPLREVFLRLLVVNAFIFFLCLFLPFTTGGETLFSIGPLNATREGIIYALLITVKSNTIVVALIALLATTPIITLGHALSHLYVPDKLIHLLFFTVRYLNGYGNLIPRWSGNILDWLYVSKYPPSIAFLLWTLGGTCIFMAAGIMISNRGWTSRNILGAIHTFGRVPLFFYIIHLWIYKLRLPHVEPPFYLDLAQTFGLYLVGLVVLWLFSTRYEGLKKTHPRFLQYI